MKFSLTLLLVFVLYKLFLSNEKAHKLKRFYLLGGLFLSVIISFIEIETPIPIHSIKAPKVLISSVVLSYIILGVYIILVILFLVRFGRNIADFSRKIHINERSEVLGKTIILIDDKTLPYSFFNYVFVNKAEYQNGNITEAMLLHEIAHVNQKHTIDVVFLEFIQILFWFNPIVWLYKKEVKLNHEYLADNSVLSSGVDQHVFQNLLLNIAAGNKASYLACSFTYSLTKKRLIMLGNTSSTVRMFIKLLLLIPLFTTATIFISYSNENVEECIEKCVNVLQPESAEPIKLLDLNFKSEFIHSSVNNENSYEDYCTDECSETVSN